MLTVFARTAILYAVSVLAMRLMGKRQVGQLQPYELVLALMIAELAAAPMETVDTPLAYGIVPIGALVFFYGLATLLSVRFPAVHRFLSGGPSVVIRKGVIQYGEMRRICYTVSDLMEELRGQGYLNVADVATAVLETSGKLSVAPHAGKRPATPEDLGLTVEDEEIPMTLVVDGAVQREHLQALGLNEAWLQKRLTPLGLGKTRDVLIASMDAGGKLFVQGKAKNARAHLIDTRAAKEA